MFSSEKILRDAVTTGTSTLQSLVDLAPQVTQAAELLIACLVKENKILACGNGGSAADCADFCTELACRFVEDRQPYPALNLAQGGSLLTATANDYGFEEIFARQVRAFGRPNDLLIAISTSGKSANIRRALEQARDLKLKSIALLGRDGGECRGIADVDLVVKGKATARIQEAHKFLLHVLCEICEDQLGTYVPFMRLRSLLFLVLILSTSPLFALQPNIPAGTLQPGMVVQTRFGPLNAIVSAPPPIVPPGHFVYNHGVYAIDIEVVTSSIPSVRVLRSCGDPEVDRAMIETLREWRFQPRIIYKLIVPIDFAGSRVILGGR